MSKKKHKKSKQEMTTQKILLLTATIQLINVVISLIKTLFE